MGFLHLKRIVTTQEKRNFDLAGANAQLRKQLAQLQAKEAELKKRNDSLDGDIVVERAAREAAKRERVLNICR